MLSPRLSNQNRRSYKPGIVAGFFSVKLASKPTRCLYLGGRSPCDLGYRSPLRNHRTASCPLLLCPMTASEVLSNPYPFTTLPPIFVKASRKLPWLER